EEARRMAELVKILPITEGFTTIQDAWKLVVIRFMSTNDWFRVFNALNEKRERARQKLVEKDPRRAMKLLDAMNNPEFGISAEEAELMRPGFLFHNCPLVEFPHRFQTQISTAIDESKRDILQRIMHHVGLDLYMDI
ncbi:TPA: hypothetical protein DIC21_04470, partial [Candidatus Uhrbacteria bacterium]|nr:hypothetical protein [Candidatus Uhrbacteria bacterium]